jgi:UDP-N-acetylglucosamine 2-epimerase
MAPTIAELQRQPEEFTSVLVHTGQHYDATMSEVFLEELGVKDAAGVLTDSGGIQGGWDGHAARRIVDVFVRAELARAPVSL